MISINYYNRVTWKSLFDMTLFFIEELFIENDFYYNSTYVPVRPNTRFSRYVNQYGLALTSLVRFYYQFEKKALSPAATDVIK